MDLRAFELRLDRRDLRAKVADAAGERQVTVEGQPFVRVAESARPLLERLSERAGPVFALSVDAVRRIVRAASAVGAVTVVGTDYEALEDVLAPVARAAMGELRTRRPDPDGTPSEAAFWQSLYRSGGDGWELARAAPPLERWLGAYAPTGRGLVVGCGRGHEARLLARLGVETVAIDFAPEAIAEAEQLAQKEGVAVDFRVRDLFALPAEPERYDLIVEHCCFCAIEVARRDEYVRVVAELLVGGGVLAGLFYAHGRPGGPPFSVGRDELERRFEGRFEVVHMEMPRDSVANRQGQELLAIFKKR
jgi:SAM-dependent methyltransferase